jgi:hypothetical protein
MTRRLAVRDWRTKSVQDQRVYTRLTLVIVIADLDTLLTAPYVELTDRAPRSSRTRGMSGSKIGPLRWNPPITV